MKTLKVYTVIAIVAVMASCAWQCQAQDVNIPESGLGFLLGYRGINIKNTYSHNTHPGDGFLPNANVPGSAGTTTIDGTSSFGLLGLRFQPKPMDKWTVNFDAGALIGGQRVDRQNANDPRPAGNGAFVYSEDRFGFLAGVGVAYNVNRWSFGAQAEAAGVFVDSGWNRFGQDESSQNKLVWQLGIGPKVGFRFSDAIRAEASVLFGDKNPTFAFTLTAFLWK